jgi:hypothetical protein
MRRCSGSYPVDFKTRKAALALNPKAGLRIHLGSKPHTAAKSETMGYARAFRRAFDWQPQVARTQRSGVRDCEDTLKALDFGNSLLGVHQPTSIANGFAAQQRERASYLYDGETKEANRMCGAQGLARNRRHSRQPTSVAPRWANTGVPFERRGRLRVLVAWSFESLVRRGIQQKSRMISAEQWYRVTLRAADCGMRGKARTMQDAFEALFEIHGAPRNAALFTMHDDRFENYYFYFSPGAAKIGRSLVDGYSAEPCPPPLRDEYTPVLLVGHSDARETLLPRAD